MMEYIDNELDGFAVIASELALIRKLLERLVDATDQQQEKPVKPKTPPRAPAGEVSSNGHYGSRGGGK